jgi:hypothetical protein
MSLSESILILFIVPVLAYLLSAFFDFIDDLI